MGKHVDLTNKTFYSLKVLKALPYKRINNSSAWLCRCDCGKLIETNTKALTSHQKKSCGCTRYNKDGTLQHKRIRKYGKNLEDNKVVLNNLLEEIKELLLSLEKEENK